MRLLQQYIDFTDEELCDAEKYVKVAGEAKANGRTAEFENAIKLANEEINHALSWHSLIVDCIDKKRTELKAANIAIPEYMTYMWNKEHDDYVERISKMKYKIDILRK